MPEGNLKTTAQQLQASLSAVKEDKIVGALSSSLDLLRQACHGDNSGPTQGVQFRVTCCCLVLQRAATLVSCSDFLLPEVIAVLQERVHATQEVQAALLEAHLAELLRVPPAFELVLRSFPSDPDRLAQFYARLLLALPPESVLLNPAGMLAAHVRRELQKLIQGQSLMAQGEAAIDFAPHLPWLLLLAIRTCASSPGAAPTLDSCVSESTAMLSGARGARPAPASPGLWGGDVAVKAAAACLHVLRSPHALLGHLGMAHQRRSESDHPQATADCLAVLIGGGEAVRKQISKAASLATAVGVVEALLETFLLSPQAATVIELASRREADQEHTAIPVSAASNAGGLSPRRQPVTASEAHPKPAADLQERERALLDLLSLHEALVALQGRSVGEGESPERISLLSAPALLALAGIALRQLQSGGSCDGAPRRSSTRTCTPSNLRSTDERSCLPPRVMTHLLMLLTAARPDLEDPADCAHLALSFVQAAFKGPQPLVAYRVLFQSAQAVASRRNLQDDSPAAISAATPASEQEGHDRPAKRAKVESPGNPAAAPSAVITTALAGPAMTHKTVAVGPQPPRGFSRLRPPPSCTAEEVKQASSSGQMSALQGPQVQPLPHPQAKPQPEPSIAAAEAKKKPKPRRITPTPVPAAEAEQAQVEASIFDSLALQKDEYDAYWEHYIAVKEELVATILQDTPGEEGSEGGEQPLCSSPRRSKSKKLRRSQWSSSVNFNPAFREPEWQNLHAAALGLLTGCLQALDSEGGDHDRTAVWQVLSGEAAWLDHKQMALLGSRIVDPSVSSGRRLTAAKLGAKELPHECLVLAIAIRMAQYCIGPGIPVSPPLASGFLRLLCLLMARCAEEASEAAPPEESERIIRPLELVGGALLACVERGCLRCCPLDAESLACLLRCTLPAIESAHGLQLASAALWGALQEVQPRNAPPWLASSCHSWLELWARVIAPGHIRAVCSEILALTPHLLAELQEARNADDTTIRSANSRLDAQAGLAAALACFCDAVVGRGKAVATGGALKDCLLCSAMLLQASAAACEALAVKLRRPRPEPVATPGTGRSRKGRGRRHRNLTPVPAVESPQAEGGPSPGRMQKEAGSVRALAALAGAGSSLATAAGKVLDWRLQKCPGRSQQLAAALADLRSVFDESWRRLKAASSGCSSLEVELELQRAAGDPHVPDPAADEQVEGSEELEDAVEERQGKGGGSKQIRKNWRPQNAYLRAALAEDHRLGADSEDDSCYSDLEDFIVCKPDRDYGALIAKEFKYRSSHARS